MIGNGIRMGTNLRFNYGALFAEEFGRVVAFRQVVSSDPNFEYNAIVELEGGSKTEVNVENIRSPGETSVNGSAIGVYIDDRYESLDAFLQSEGRQADS